MLALNFEFIVCCILTNVSNLQILLTISANVQTSGAGKSELQFKTICG